MFFPGPLETNQVESNHETSRVIPPKKDNSLGVKPSTIPQTDNPPRLPPATHIVMVKRDWSAIFHEHLPTGASTNAARLEGRITIQATGWTKFKEAVALIFEAIGKFFKRMIPIDPQKTPERLVNHYTFEDGTEIGREVSIRKRGISNLVLSKSVEILKCQDPKELRELERELKQYQLAGEDTWATANRVRDGGTQNPISNYLPAVVNHRTRLIETENQSISITCSGAISHMADGSTNLRELATANKLDEREVRERLLTDQMVQYIAGQVQSFASEIVNPESLTRQTTTLNITQVSLLDPSKPTKMEKGILINECNQMIDMVEMFKLFNGYELAFSDQITAPILHNGQVLIPRLLLGNISDVQWKNLQEDVPLKLSCSFFNCSVQGLTANLNPQKEINSEAMDHLKDQWVKLSETNYELYLKIAPKISSIEARLNGGESSYELARDIILLQHEMHGVTGINCYSGKDRTGYLSSLIAYDFFEKVIDSKDSLTEEEKQKAKRALASDLTGPEGLTAKIIEQNTGHTVLKIKKARLLGVNEGATGFGFAGYLLRMAQAVNAFFAKS